jgi:hypothetical protein
VLLKRIVLGLWLVALACFAWALADRRADARRTAAQAAPQGRQYTPPNYVFSPDIPKDIVTHNVGAIGFQPFVDILAWDTFIALNWPVPQALAQRGVPDRQNVIGGVPGGGGGEGGGGAGMPVGPTVWETFKDTEDIFLNPPVAPKPFDAAESIPQPCLLKARDNPEAARRTLTMTAKVSDVLRDFKQAGTGLPLIDQNGQRVWYEVKVNRAYYDYVVANRFYDSRYQQGKVIAFPSSSNTTGDVPAIKIKSAWKVMGGPGSKQPDDFRKFYTTQAFVYDPDTRVCSVQTVGLVGLHVVMKTALLPQWSWATFEHVDNAPDQQAGPVSGKQYNFFNARCAGCTPNTPPPPANPNMPTQVVRLVPVSGVSPNGIYQAALKTLRPDNVWQNYMLVDAQWAGSRDNIGVPNQPKYLANATLETYLQQPVEDSNNPHGCINCHGKYAGNRDLDFQLFKAYPRQANLTREVLSSVGNPNRLPPGRPVGRPARR